jgi:hypothetical protein
MTPWVKRILLANVGVFFIQLTVGQAATQFLAFIPSLALVRPWSFVTYMFAHSPTSVTHILFNMLVLYFFGPRVEERLGSGNFVRLYFAAGITGAILSIVFNQGGYIIGASGAVFGVQLAFAKYWPRERIYIWGILPVEAWLRWWWGWRRTLRAPRRLSGGVAVSVGDGASLAGSRVEDEGRETCQEGRARELEDHRHEVDPRGESGRGGSDSRQDQREGGGQPNAAGADVPLSLCPAGR